MTRINWSTTTEDGQLIQKITDRAVRTYKELGVKVDYQSVMMDITACHLNGCPLDLVAMLTADDFNFGHDISGIARYIDRDTGKLTQCFLPRFALKNGRG